MGAATAMADFIQLIFSLAASFVVLRFLLHLSRADYFNPITQGVVKATNPLILPLQAVLKPSRRCDWASLVAAFLIKGLGITAAVGIASQLGAVTFVNITVGALIGTLNNILDIYFFALIISIVLSWVAPQANHPGAALVYQLTEPLMAPVRRFIPALGGLDLSPIFIFLGIGLAKKIIMYSLGPLAGMHIYRFLGF